MAEQHDADRGEHRDRQDGPEGRRDAQRRPDGAGGLDGQAGQGSSERPGEGEERRLDEDAAWAAIIAGYGDEPPDPPGAKPFRSVEDLALLEEAAPEAKPDKFRTRAKREEVAEVAADDAGDDGGTPEKDTPEGRPALGSSVVFAPGVGATRGPRDYELAEPADDDAGAGAGTGKNTGKGRSEEEDDEGHFVPPEPPPLPEADSATRFAWLGVVGGPVLMLVAVLLQWEMTWWLTTVCVGGFLGGFATLVARMKDGDDDEYDDPGRGAVV
ncbi:hypothetical protein [Streptomyces sp. TRM49041]|uniref:hypothetical protein n=1 Tax=Streptomyces sp. TRM49041 TaxID=2603216 RepID=UPI0011ED39AB|nr:hypothetical protein [Streptomyces sp. TRM49041]